MEVSEPAEWETPKGVLLALWAKLAQLVELAKVLVLLEGLKVAAAPKEPGEEP